MTEEEQKLDVPQGLSNPWVFVQKRIIFEKIIILNQAMTKYFMVYSRSKENDALLQDAVMQMRNLWIEIKEIVRKNKKCKRDCECTIKYMDDMISSTEIDWDSKHFPVLWKHYVSMMDMTVYIGLRDIESKTDDPHQAIMSGGTA